MNISSALNVATVIGTSTIDAYYGKVPSGIYTSTFMFIQEFISVIDTSTCVDY